MLRTLLAVAVAASVVPLLPAQAAEVPAGLRVVSSRPDTVSGGDAVVEITRTTSLRGVRVTAAGRDVTARFARRADGRLKGLVTGLRPGPNTLTVRSPAGRTALTVVDHSTGGPVFAGPQVQPWLCGTQANGLGAARDRQCNAPTRVTYRYKTTTGSFAAYDPASPPTDVATTTTDRGVTVPFVVRTERGTADRGIYELSVLADPRCGSAPGPRPEAGTASSCGTSAEAPPVSTRRAHPATPSPPPCSAAATWSPTAA